VSRPHRSADRVAHRELSGPWVLDVRAMSRQPGHLRRVSLDVDAPDDLGTEIITAVPGSTIHLDLRLETVAEGIVATGTVSAAFAGECVRCLATLAFTETADFQELYVYSESDAEDDEALRLSGDDLDLEQAVRDALVLDLPFQPLCRADCPGLCVECGFPFAEDPGHHHDDGVDPRWAALQALAGDEQAQTGESETLDRPNDRKPFGRSPN
jgi:uncharacterized protein